MSVERAGWSMLHGWLGSLLGAALALVCLAVLQPAGAQAQRQVVAPEFSLGGGLSLGNTEVGSVMRASPVFLEGVVNLWNTEQPDLVYGLGARVELGGRVSAAALLRAAIHRELGPVSLRPSVGIPVFVAPFSLLGIEGATAARYEFMEDIWAVGRVMVDAFFFGSDLPEDGAVVMVNFAAGVEIKL